MSHWNRSKIGNVVTGLIASGVLLGAAAGCGGEDSEGTASNPERCQQPEQINSDITEDTIWDGEPGCLDYRITDAIDVSASLTIGPGTRVEVDQGNYLEVQGNGAISAEGTEQEGITFAGTEETAGFWRGIAVGSQTRDNVFDYVEIRDAGAQWSGDADSKAAVYLGNGHLRITNSTFRNNAHSALQVWESDGSIEGFDNNTFENNGTPMWLHPEHVGSLAGTSTFSGHDTAAIQVTFGQVNSLKSEATWKAFEIPYRLMGRTQIEAGLTLQAGTTVEVNQNVRMTVQSPGSLSAEGTPEAPVLIRGTEELAGHWKGLAFRSSSTDNQLAHTTVLHAGSNDWTGMSDKNSAASIYIGDGGTVSLDNTTIKQSGYHGVYILSGQILSCEGTTFEDIPGANVRNLTEDEMAACGL